MPLIPTNRLPGYAGNDPRTFPLWWDGPVSFVPDYHILNIWDVDSPVWEESMEIALRFQEYAEEIIPYAIFHARGRASPLPGVWHIMNLSHWQSSVWRSDVFGLRDCAIAINQLIDYLNTYYSGCRRSDWLVGIGTVSPEVGIADIAGRTLSRFLSGEHRCCNCGLPGWILAQSPDWDCGHRYCANCSDLCEHCLAANEEDMDDEEYDDGYAPVFDKRTLRYHEGVPKSGLNRFIGAEIEIASFAGRSDWDSLDNWNVSVVQDGSIPSEGRELVTSAAKRSAWPSMIRDICQDIKQAGGKVDKSCGLHIHVDTSDLSASNLRTLIRLYAALEDTFFSLCDSARYDGEFSQVCGPYYTGQLLPAKSKRGLAELLYEVPKKTSATRLSQSSTFVDVSGQAWVDNAKTLREARKTFFSAIKKTKYVRQRYYALNLHSIAIRNTVEFRHHEGTVDPTTIINWGLLCGYLVDAAKKLRESTVITALDAAPRDSGGLTILAPDGKLVAKTALKLLDLPADVAGWVAKTLKDNVEEAA